MECVTAGSRVDVRSRNGTQDSHGRSVHRCAAGAVVGKLRMIVRLAAFRPPQNLLTNWVVLEALDGVHHAKESRWLGVALATFAASDCLARIGGLIAVHSN